MSEEKQGNGVINAGSGLSEPAVNKEETREYLVNKARDLQLNFPPNITTEKLKKLISDKISSLESRTSLMNTTGALQYKEARALVRCRITVLNPAKKDWKGEIITVSNDNIPKVSEFVPFNATDGIWHLPRIIVEALKTKKYAYRVNHSRSKEDSLRNYGIDPSKTKMLPEYLIEELPPLSPEELKLLAQEQLANGSFLDDK